MPKNPYSKEFKESILKRLVPPDAEKMPALSKETGIPLSTLYTWRNRLRKDNPTSNKKSTNWSSSDKFQAVLETASLSEHETAKYCREKALAETAALLVLRKKANAIWGTPRKINQ